LSVCGYFAVMSKRPVSYKRHRFPPVVIAHAVWLYFRFPLSLRLVEETCSFWVCLHAAVISTTRYWKNEINKAQVSGPFLTVGVCR
jgi:transposase-like protein